MGQVGWAGPRRVDAMIAEGRGTTSVWLKPAPAGRAGPPLTRERITAAAVALLDTEGLDRLTMRRLADRLEVGTTTLYWHVDAKEDVLDLAVDAVFAESPPPARHSDDWRADITTLLMDWRRTLLRHPWSAALPLRQRPTIGPGFLAWMEFLQTALLRAGFTGRHLAAASWVLYSHVQGSAASQTNLRWTRAEREAGQEQLAAHRELYPTLAAQQHLLDDDWSGNFELGLTYLLDGFEAQVSRSGG